MTDRNFSWRDAHAPLRYLFATLVLLLALALPSAAKITIDFDPNLDFSKFKTFAYIGGVENLVMMQLNPDLINTRVHRMVVRELEKKGLREVAPEQNPDLVVRYWANSETQVDVAVMGNWGVYGPYIGSYWGYLYNTVIATNQRQGTLILDLIDPKAKALAWRVYLVRKLSDPDRDWKKAEEEFTEGFKSYPPSDKEKEEKRREREKQDAAKKPS
ncbi:MAG TPA: DUF4136 domain-containing protein [Candidatus Acidoferrum sp.]|nr:DUF4136 domain-containing protein [Candidatus Acidoferrum sp.]